MPRSKKQFIDPEPITFPSPNPNPTLKKLERPPSVDRLLMGEEGASYRRVTTILVNGAHTLQPSNGTPAFHRHTEMLSVLHAAYNRNDRDQFLYVLEDYMRLAVGQFPHAGKREGIESDRAEITRLMESVQDIHEALGIKMSGFRYVAGKMLARVNAPL